MGMTFTDSTQSQLWSGRFAVVLLVFCETCTKESIEGKVSWVGGGLSHLWLPINFSEFLVFHSKLISHLQIFKLCLTAVKKANHWLGFKVQNMLLKGAAKAIPVWLSVKKLN